MSETILLVDDDEVFRTRLARALRSRGYLVQEACDYESALSKIDEERADKAVIDLRIPGGSGLQVLESLKQKQNLCEALVLTGYGTIGTAVEAMKLGAKNYLSKPTHTDAILEAFDIDSARSQEKDVPTLSQVEWEHMQRVVQDCDGNITQAAKLLGLHRRSLQRKLQKKPGELS